VSEPVRRPDVHVRRAVPSDAPALAALHEPLHTLHARAEPETYPPFDLAATLTYYAQLLASGDLPVWVADLGGRPVGFVGGEVLERPATPFTRPLRVFHVHQVSVAPDARRLGVASALMDVVEQEAVRAGCSRVRLDHRAFNDAAHRFYEAIGFRTSQVSMSRPVLRTPG
jgi:ribosomal protein S18 acetylase RimI-like enzyme